jgi:hypothetical protein
MEKNRMSKVGHFKIFISKVFWLIQAKINILNLK